MALGSPLDMTSLTECWISHRNEVAPEHMDKVGLVKGKPMIETKATAKMNSDRRRDCIIKRSQNFCQKWASKVVDGWN
jgi:hypothetical protein